MKLLFGNALNPFEILQAFLVAIAVVVAWLKPRAFAAPLARIESWLRQFSARPLLSCVAVALLPLLLRAALLPIYPPPQPAIHDEFAFLLQADTFASGRWTNPTPPSPEHFESIYILVRPTYTGQYQMAQPLVLAAAKAIAGSAWLGVFLSMGVFCGLLVWMLRAWLPAPWALVGGLIAAFQFGVLSYWMNSYFGGVIPGIGGALALGALPRLQRSARPKHSLILAAGLAILMHSRPLEAFLLFLVSICALFFAHRLTLRTLAPLAAVLCAALALMAFYNSKVTGNPTELPYRANQKQYGTPQTFFWQPPILIANLANPQLREEYLTQLRFHERRRSLKALAINTAGRLRTFWGFFLTPVFTIPLICLPRIWRLPGMGLALAIAVVFGFEYLTFFAFLPQYAAPVAGVILLVILQCLRRLRTSPGGLFLSRALPLICALSVFIPMLGRACQPVLPAKLKSLWASEFGEPMYRAKFLDRLHAQGGRHLVLVHYQPDHQVDTEWVYNDADIPDSPVIWARSIDPESDRKLVQLFPGRKVWLGEPDAVPPALIPISP